MSQIINLTIQGQQPSSNSTSGSLKLAQEQPKQHQLTDYEVATIIDEAHGVVDPCQNTRNAASYHPTPAPGQSLPEFQQEYLATKYNSTVALEDLAGKFGGDCAVKQGKPITLEIYAFWSDENIADDYRLICPVGRIDNPRRIKARFRLVIEVTNSSSVDFGYYVFRPRSPATPIFKDLFWISGNIIDKYGKAKEISAPQWDGGTRLYWGETIASGHIFVEFQTVYDIWDCTLQGVWTDGKRDYAASVIGIWRGTSPVLPLVVPDAAAEEADTCYEYANVVPAIDLSVPTNKIIGGVEVTGPPSAPPATPPPEDEDDDAEDCDCGDPCTAEGYEEICCRPGGDICVPTCLEYHGKNRGGLLPEGGIDGLKAKYGDNVKIKWVYPADGDCGTHTDKLVLPGGSCDECKDVEPLVWGEDNPDLIAPGGSVGLSVVGGTGIVTWEINGGTGYTFGNGGTKIVGGNSVTVYADSEVCGSTSIEADDGCSQASGPLDFTGGISLPVSVTLSPGSYKNVSKTGGLPPYDWSVDGLTITGGGTETSTYVRVYMEPDSCSDGSISVSDACSSDVCDVINTRTDISLPESVELSPGYYKNVSKTGGLPPYNWSVDGLTITGGGTATHTYVRVYMEPDSCGDGSITVSDACSEATCAVVNTRTDISLPDSIDLDPGYYVNVSKTGGLPPYDWSVDGLTITGGGTATHTYARVLLESDSCGNGSVSVSDACSNATCAVVNTRTDISLPESITLDPGEIGGVVKEGGAPPYNWSVSGVTITAGGGPNSDYINVRMDEGSTANGSISVSDACSDATCDIINTGGE